MVGMKKQKKADDLLSMVINYCSVQLDFYCCCFHLANILECGHLHYGQYIAMVIA